MLINYLLFTILIEVCISLLFGVKKRRDIINIILVNIVTNPIVVLFPYVAYLFYGKMVRCIVLLLLELFTVIVEGYIYNRYLDYSKVNSYLLSLVLNISSYLLGVVVNYFV